MNDPGLVRGVEHITELVKKIGATNCYNREPEWEIEMNVLCSELKHKYNVSYDDIARMVAAKLEGKDPFTARWQTFTPMVS